ncbi:GNAT family N-acetyltransferase [Nocardia testacea]|uniref:GNAT family N-acetyltransferase n=1 Tax=Nocardia testacea TaxID=248551 RepID=UPI003A8B01B2
MTNPTDTPSGLARELTEIPEEVRVAPAPALPHLAAPFEIRLADPEGPDPDLLADWMNRPHLVKAWEQPWSAEQRRANLRAQLAGSYSRPCILGFDFAAIDRPDLGRREVAYLEVYRAAKDEIARLYHADPYDVGFHIATAEHELLGRGVIAQFFFQLVAGIFEAEPRCRRIMADPDHRNVATRRVVEKYGWPCLGEFDIRPDRRIMLLTTPRTPDDFPTLRD